MTVALEVKNQKFLLILLTCVDKDDTSHELGSNPRAHHDHILVRRISEVN